VLLDDDGALVLLLLLLLLLLPVVLQALQRQALRPLRQRLQAWPVQAVFGPVLLSQPIG
jgi:hypothetical protein